MLGGISRREVLKAGVFIAGAYAAIAVFGPCVSQRVDQQYLEDTVEARFDIGKTLPPENSVKVTCGKSEYSLSRATFESFPLDKLGSYDESNAIDGYIGRGDTSLYTYDSASRLGLTLRKNTDEIHTIWMHHLRSMQRDGSRIKVKYVDGEKETFDKVGGSVSDEFFGPDRCANFVYGLYQGIPKRINFEHITRLDIDSTGSEGDIEKIIAQMKKYWFDNGVDITKTWVMHDGTQLTTDDCRLAFINWFHGWKVMWGIENDTVSFYQIRDGQIVDGDTRQLTDLDRIVLNFTGAASEAPLDISMHFKDGSKMGGYMNKPGDYKVWFPMRDRFEIPRKHGRALLPLKRVKEIVIVGKESK